MDKPKVSVFYTIWGHQSIGTAAKDAVDKYLKIYSNLIKPNSLSIKPYNMLYILFPSLVGIPYKISDSNNLAKIAEKYFSKIYEDKIEKLVKSQKPKIVISAYFAFNFTLLKLAKKYGFIFINIISDPRTIHKLIVFKGAYNFVFDKDSYKKCLNYGVPKDELIQSGWFVRKEFQPVNNKHTLQNKLGISPDNFTISIIGGSEGTVSILKILPAFIDIKKNLNVIFICGKNKGLYRSLNAFEKLHKLSKSNGVKFIIKGFTHNTHEYMQISDLVIGKAGPNLLFESVATHTPFLAISHISGQEDGNLQIIKKYKIGFVEENSAKAIRLTRKIIQNPKILDHLKEPIQNLAEYNKNSYSILNSFIEQKLKKS